ncbi:hypothetical protein MR781_04950 [bacterium]|uniref:hypothetical protein n=1 Tax=Bariatricus sp. HCP28S3_D3 TaxID=3438901 RepID=UPI002A84F8C8|nr:hypothetical protein [bacterium]MDY4504329.1 hypothetical protein [Bariatricus sp.]
MIKKIAVRASVLTAVFIMAVIVFSYLTNRGNTDMSADMDGATLPRISFVTEGYEINSIPGYKNDMEIPSMRDTLTPVENREIELHLEKYDTQVQKMTWQVFTLDGEKCLQQETLKEIGDVETLKLKGDGILDEERVLKVTLHLENEDVYYYTRIRNQEGCNYKTCLDFANTFHERAMKKEQTDELEPYLETTSDGAVSTYQTVTIHSDLNHVVWGELRPQVAGDVLWEVKECNETYTSILLTYRVRCAGVSDNPEALYTVKEFFRVRVVGDKQYLMDYNRTMTQNFDGTTKALGSKGILLGIAPVDLEYQINSEGTIVSFVQNNELWNYDKDADEMSLVFSFADAENVDIRNFYDRHEIHIVSVDQVGNTTFTVSGYMNRGTHEGETGVAVYYFDSEKNSVAEKAFVPSSKGYYVMKEELGKYVYYSNKSEMLYVMMDGTLYSVDMEEDTREVLVRGLENGQYTASQDGHLLAYQGIGGKVNESEKITVLNLQTGDSFEIDAENGEYLKPVGFIKDDFAYGTLKSEDGGQTLAGQSVYPMYKLQIINQKQEIVKTYEVADVYLLDGYINDNMLQLNRVAKNGNIYMAITPDYITNNEEQAESNIKLESYTEDTRQKVMRLTYEDGIKDSNAKLLKPKQVLFDKSMTIRFDESTMDGKYYVYALGELQGVYERASYAVIKANEVNGVAVSSRQAYVWERGNWPSVYEVENMTEFQMEEGETAMAACLQQMLQKEGKTADVVKELNAGKSPETILSTYIGGEGLDLTGCTTEEILYTISRETPVIAMFENGHTVLAIGYNKTNIAYLDPADGKRYSVTFAEMESKVGASGNTFIGYVK